MRPLQSVRSNRTPADWFAALAFLGFMGAALATLAGFAADQFWLGELAVHFRVQWAGVLLITALFFSVRRRWIFLPAGVGLCLVNLILVAPAYLPDARRAAEAGRRAAVEHKALSLLAINVFTDNRNAAAVARVIEERNADLVGLIEVGDKWIAALAAPLGRYPYHVEMLSNDSMGIGLWSRLPLRDASIRYFGEGGIPAVVATVVVNGADITVIVVHLWPPKNLDMMAVRDNQILDLAFSRGLFASYLVLAGDLNLTPWSSSFTMLEDTLGVRDTRPGFGLQPSWPADMMVLGIPIDHCLISPGLRAIRREVGPKVGSDHLPLYVELGFTQ